MKIAHLADLHICGMNKQENFEKTEQLIVDALNEGVDHFVFAGDISHDASVLDFKLLKKLLIRYNLYTSHKSSIIIGNHDIFGGVYFASDILTYPAKIRRIDYSKKLYQFEQIFIDLFDNSITASRNSFFPFAKIIDEHLFLGINSIMEYSHILNPMASNGKIGPADFEMISSLLHHFSSGVKRKFVLMHHHFIGKNFFEKKHWWNRIENYTMKIYGKSKLLNLFNKYKIDLVLHGHVHQNYQYSLSNTKFLCGGGSIENDRDDNIRYNLISTNNDQLKIGTKILRFKKQKITESELIEQLIPSLAG